MKTITWLVLLALGLTTAGCAMTESRFFALRAAITCEQMDECESPRMDQFDSVFDCQATYEEAFVDGWAMEDRDCELDPDEADLCIDAMRSMPCEDADPEYMPEEDQEKGTLTTKQLIPADAEVRPGR